MTAIQSAFSVLAQSNTFTGQQNFSGLINANAGLSSQGEIFVNDGLNTSGGAPILTGVAGTNGGGGVQLSDTNRDYMIYLEVGTAGTAWIVTMGHNSSANDVTVHASGVATAGQVLSFLLPTGWFFAWSATTATLAQSVAVGT